LKYKDNDAYRSKARYAAVQLGVGQYRTESGGDQNGVTSRFAGHGQRLLQ